MLWVYLHTRHSAWVYGDIEALADIRLPVSHPPPPPNYNSPDPLAHHRRNYGFYEWGPPRTAWEARIEISKIPPLSPIQISSVVRASLFWTRRLRELGGFRIGLLTWMNLRMMTNIYISPERRGYIWQFADTYLKCESFHFHASVFSFYGFFLTLFIKKVLYGRPAAIM